VERIRKENREKPQNQGLLLVSTQAVHPDHQRAVSRSRRPTEVQRKGASDDRQASAHHLAGKTAGFASSYGTNGTPHPEPLSRRLWRRGVRTPQLPAQ